MYRGDGRPPPRMETTLLLIRSYNIVTVTRRISDRSCLLHWELTSRESTVQATPIGTIEAANCEAHLGQKRCGAGEASAKCCEADTYGSRSRAATAEAARALR